MKITIALGTTSDESFFQQIDAEHAQRIFQFLPRKQRENLIEMQYLAKISAYKSQWPDATTYLVKSGRLGIGKIILSTYKSGMHIIDVVIAEKYRNKGIGRQLLMLVEQRALDIGCTKLTLSVATNNRAKALYDHLGYKVTVQNETQIAMKKQLMKG